MPVQAQQVIPPQQTQQAGLIDSLLSFVKNYWGFLLFIGILIVFVYFVYMWRRERQKKELTVYHRIRDKIEELCRIQADRKRIISNPTMFLGISGIISVIIWMVNIIIFKMTGFFTGGLFAFTSMLVMGVVYSLFSPFTKRDMVFLRYRQEGRTVEKYVGDYAGEYYDSTGYLNLLVYKGRKNLFFRNKYVIRIPQSVNSFYDLEQLEKTSKSDKEYADKLKKIYSEHSDFINDLVQFNDRTIVINYAKSLDKFKFIYYPVFVDDFGLVINKGVNYYKGIKEQTALEQLYDLTDESSKAQIKAIQINPRVQYKQATGDEVIDDVESLEK